MTAPLDKLHEFYEPTPPAWTPQTVGWYCAFALAAIAAAWALVWIMRKRLRNRYRREALHALETTKADGFSALLKRTALSAWPREEVASLSGSTWLHFLDHAMSGSGFLTPPGNRVEAIAFGLADISAEDEAALRELTARWIRRHRVRA
jgi:H+/Cl- antiporter ClcA